MLSRSRRIAQNSFRSLSRGRSFSADLASIRVSPLPLKESPARFAVVVSKKVAKTAVERNRLRRKVYGVLKQLAPLTMPGVAVIVYPRMEALAIGAPTLSKTLQGLLSDARALQTS